MKATARRWMWILWPGFVMAIPAVGVVFTLVDPEELHWSGSAAANRMAAYTLGFFFFWALGAASSAMTDLLQRSSRDLNR
jgi:hypothetical protein